MIGGYNYNFFGFWPCIFNEHIKVTIFIKQTGIHELKFTIMFMWEIVRGIAVTTV